MINFACRRKTHVTRCVCGTKAPRRTTVMPACAPSKAPTAPCSISRPVCSASTARITFVANCLSSSTASEFVPLIFHRIVIYLFDLFDDHYRYLLFLFMYFISLFHYMTFIIGIYCYYYLLLFIYVFYSIILVCIIYYYYCHFYYLKTFKELLLLFIVIYIYTFYFIILLCIIYCYYYLLLFLYVHFILLFCCVKFIIII